MKRTRLFFHSNQFCLLAGLMLLSLCAAGLAPAAQQPKDERRVRAFVLEGIGAKDTDAYTSKGFVEVIRDGKKLQLFPGDELREGDRVRRVKETSNAIFSGASVAIYNDDGEPVLLVGHNQGVDFTLSRLRFAPARSHIPKVEIINHLDRPLAVQGRQGSSDYRPPELVIYKPDGSRDRSMTDREREFYDMQMALDRQNRYDARWDRAARLITEGRKGAATEYSADEAAYEAEARQRRADSNQREQAKLAEEDGLKKERTENNISITGTWNSSVGYVYEITQTGSTFKWKIINNPAYNERADGELKGKIIKAKWTNRNGTDSAEGEVTQFGADGRATYIKWKNGVWFSRN